jgi:hypothetical protein
MKELFRKRSAVIALCILLSLVVVQVASADVPFKGQASAEIISVVPGPTGVLMTAVATGNATHLGKFTREEHILLDPNTGSFTGDITFTSADGDQLVGTITGAFTSATTATGSYEWTGGTGRFENASGTVYFVATLSDQVHFDVEFNGILNK